MCAHTPPPLAAEFYKYCRAKGVFMQTVQESFTVKRRLALLYQPQKPETKNKTNPPHTHTQRTEAVTATEITAVESEKTVKSGLLKWK